MGIKWVTKRVIVVLLLVLLVTGTTFADAGYSNFSRIQDYSDSGFMDVSDDMWYAEQVEFGYELGLLSGKGVGIFDPMGSVTLAETMTLASIVHARFYDIEIPKFSNQNWYDSYVEYCYLMGICDRYVFEDRDLNAPATREEVAGIFGRILPRYDVTLPNASPPDVVGLPEGAFSDKGEWIGGEPEVDESLFYEQIIALYRAGIIVGSDSKGTFYPKHDITRAETVTILNNVVDPTRRTAYANEGNGDETSDSAEIDLNRLYVNNEVSGITPVLWYQGEKVGFDVEPIYQCVYHSKEGVIRNLYPVTEVMEAIGARVWRESSGFPKYYWEGRVFEVRANDWYGGTAKGIFDVTSETWIVDQVLDIQGVILAMDSDIASILATSGESVKVDSINGMIYTVDGTHGLYKVEKYEKLWELYGHLPAGFYLDREHSQLSDDQYAEIKAVVDSVVEGEYTALSKVRAINDWIADNLAYNEDNGVGDPLEGSAYEAFDKKIAVCSGYSTLSATMLRMAGIPSRVVISTEANHAWIEYYDKSNWHIIDTTGYDDGLIIDGIPNNDERYFNMPMKDVLGGPSDIEVSF